MKFTRLIIAIAVVATSALAFSQASAKDKATFNAMYKEAGKMLARKDINGLFKDATPDFYEMTNGRKVPLAEAKAGLKQFLAMFKSLNCELTMTSCVVKGNAAVTKNKAHIWGTTQPDPKTKKSSKIDATRNEVLTWVKKGGRWLMKSMVGSNEKMTMDGKPMGMGG